MYNGHFINSVDKHGWHADCGCSYSSSIVIYANKLTKQQGVFCINSAIICNIHLGTSEDKLFCTTAVNLS